MLNLYVHYDSVMNHVITRGISLTSDDFLERTMPKNLILAESPEDFGRFDAQTNFKVIRGQVAVIDYMNACRDRNARMSNWIDFESIEGMHNLTPNEIAEILYLFHATRELKSAFFYKLQNNYVYLTLVNGLNKMFYRHIHHFYPRFQRTVREKMTELLNENRSFFFLRKERVGELSLGVVEEIAPYFSAGLKVNFNAPKQVGTYWQIPLEIIEDDLSLLDNEHLNGREIGYLVYDTNAEQWHLEINDEIKEI